MNNHELVDWAEHETQRLIAAGVNPMDAERTTGWILEHLPFGADPRTWIPMANDLVGKIDKADVQDALTAWFYQVAAQGKRVLTATAK